MLKIILKYFFYKVFTQHRKGFGIHSPFVFHFVNTVLCKKDDAGLTQIKQWRKSLTAKNETIETIDSGAGSKVHGKRSRSVKNLERWSSITHKYGRVLYYLSREFQPKTIVELGTGIGISTAYLAKGNPEAGTLSVEADKVKAEFAESALKILQITPPEIWIGSFDEFLLSKMKSIEHPLLVFVDGDHQYEATMRYFLKFLEYKRDDTIFVFDDIRWSDKMEMAWNEIKAHSRTVLTIDLFFIGIVFFRKGLLKQNFKINF